MEEATEAPGDECDDADDGSHPLSMAVIRSVGTGQKVPHNDGTGVPPRRDDSPGMVEP